MKITKQHRLITCAIIVLTIKCISTTLAQESDKIEIGSNDVELVSLPLDMMITDYKGRTMEVTILSATKSALNIKRKSDGRVFDFPLAKLSDADKEIVKTFQKSAPESILFKNIPNRQKQIARISPIISKYLKGNPSTYAETYFLSNLKKLKGKEPNGLSLLANTFREEMWNGIPHANAYAFDLFRLAIQEEEEKAVALLCYAYQTPNSIPNKYKNDTYVFIKNKAEEGDPEAMLALGYVAICGHNQPSDFYHNQTKAAAYNKGHAWVKKSKSIFEKSSKEKYPAKFQYLKIANNLLNFYQKSYVATYKDVSFPINSYGKKDAKKAIIIYNYDFDILSAPKELAKLKKLIDSGWNVINVQYPHHPSFTEELVKVEEHRSKSTKSRKTANFSGFGAAVHKAILSDAQYDKFSFVASNQEAGIILWDLNTFPEDKMDSIVLFRLTQYAAPSINAIKDLPNVYAVDQMEFYNKERFYKEVQNNSSIRNWIKSQKIISDMPHRQHGDTDIPWKGLPYFYDTK